MGQIFILFNIDKAQYVNLWGKFGEFWYGRQTLHIISMLALNGAVEFPHDPLADKQADKRTLWGAHSPPEKTGLHSLSVELHFEIFKCLSSYTDIYALCLTNTYFWIVGHPCLREGYLLVARRKLNPWAGDRLVCLGEYTEDLPSENLVDEQDIMRMRVPSGEDDTLFNKLLYWASEIPTSEKWSQLYYRQLKFFAQEIDYQKHRSKRGLRRWLDAYDALIRWEEVGGVPYVLRNLTKKVYVREDELGYHEGKPAEGLDFGHLLYSKIAWSTDNSMSMSLDETGKLHRGEWAGDRFDVVRLDKFDQEGWTNISAQAKKDLSAIWESEMGENWLEELRKEEENTRQSRSYYSHPFQNGSWISIERWSI